MKMFLSDLHLFASSPGEDQGRGSSGRSLPLLRRIQTYYRLLTINAKRASWELFAIVQ